MNSSASYNASTLVSCNAAKNDGMEIYSIGIMVPSSAATFLKSCASDANDYFDASDAAKLSAAFQKIGATQASKLANRFRDRICEPKWKVGPLHGNEPVFMRFRVRKTAILSVDLRQSNPA